MNIFALDECPEKSAQNMINRHVVKMVVESTQMLQNCYLSEQLIHAPRTMGGNIRKYSYYNHPCSVWVRQSQSNFEWLLLHASGLLEEGQYRGFKNHFCQTFIEWCHKNTPENIKNCNTQTPFALAMPDVYKQDSPIESYRSYYIGDKKRDKSNKWMMIYTKRSLPEWFPEDLVEECKLNNTK